MFEAKEERTALTHLEILCIVLLTLWKCSDECTRSDPCQASVKNQAEYASILGSKPKERERAAWQNIMGNVVVPFPGLKKSKTHLIFRLQDLFLLIAFWKAGM